MHENVQIAFVKREDWNAWKSPWAMIIDVFNWRIYLKSNKQKNIKNSGCRSTYIVYISAAYLSPEIQQHYKIQFVKVPNKERSAIIVRVGLVIACFLCYCCCCWCCCDFWELKKIIFFFIIQFLLYINSLYSFLSPSFFFYYL